MYVFGEIEIEIEREKCFCILYFVFCILLCWVVWRERKRKAIKGIKEEKGQRLGRGNLECPKDSVFCDFRSIYSLSRRRVLNHPLL